MKKFAVLFLLFLTVSCTSDINFNQVSDFKLNSTYVGNFASFDFEAAQFLIGGVEQKLFSDIEFFDIVKYKSLTQHLRQVDFHFEFSNTINRPYAISINFLDENNNKVYSFVETIPAFTGSPIVVKRNEIFVNANLDLFRKSHKVDYEILMLPGDALTNNSVGRLKMHSSSTVYFQSK